MEFKVREKLFSVRKAVERTERGRSGAVGSRRGRKSLMGGSVVRERRVAVVRRWKRASRDGVAWRAGERKILGGR